MLEQQPALDCIVVPIGGGGLIAGVVVAVKGVKPEIEVIGAQAEMFDAVKANRENRAGPPYNHLGNATLAEGIAVKTPSEANMEIINAFVDHIYSASEAEIEEAVFDLLSSEKLVA